MTPRYAIAALLLVIAGCAKPAPPVATPGTFTPEKRSAIVANITDSLEEAEQIRADFNQRAKEVAESSTDAKLLR